MALQVYVVAIETRESTEPQSLDAGWVRSALEAEFESDVGHLMEVELVEQIHPALLSGLRLGRVDLQC